MGVLAYAGLRSRLGDRSGAIELVDDFAPWWYAPAPAIALAGLGLRSGILLLAGAGLAAAFAVRWGSRFGARSAPPAIRSGGLTVMTFNVEYRNRDHPSTAAVITAVGADVVAMQEVTPEAASYLEWALGARYPYRTFRSASRASGCGVLSRFPLRDVEAFHLSGVGHWAQRMTVDAPDGPLTLFNVHPIVPRFRRSAPRWPLLVPIKLDTARRRAEIRRLIRLVEGEAGPLLVVGDFNMTEYSHDYRLMRMRLSDAYVGAGQGLGLTFPSPMSFPTNLPSPWPVVRIDYVWHSPELRPIWARVDRGGGSDHRPVVVRLGR